MNELFNETLALLGPAQRRSVVGASLSASPWCRSIRRSTLCFVVVCSIGLLTFTPSRIALAESSEKSTQDDPALGGIANTPAVANVFSKWPLPATLSDSNTEVRFEVDSTWHLVKGKTSGVSGHISLAKPDDWKSVTGVISIPVDRFDTDNSSRDEKMREVMAQPTFPAVEIHVLGLEGECSPALVPCSGTMNAQLTIRGKTLKVPVSYSATHDGTHLVLTGESKFLWSDFDVEDPSIFIAKLSNVVTVKYQVKL